MGTRSDELKAEIEGTRADLTGTMNEMGDRISPGKIVARRTEGMRQKATSLKETVLGVTDQANAVGSGLSQKASGTVGTGLDSARQTPQKVVASAQRSPVAAGLIAFGAGLLLASILPSTGPEQQAAEQVLDKAQPALEAARSAAQEITADLKDTATDAVGDLRSSVTDSAAVVGDQAKSAVTEMRTAATDAAGDVKDQAQDSAQQVKERSGH